MFPGDKSTLHPWDLDPEAAISLQLQLRTRLVLNWDGRPVQAIGGVDVSFLGDQASAAIVLLRFPDLTLLTSVTAKESVNFPYIPGLLAFREAPVVLKAWKNLTIKPDLLMVDGQGIAHPRGFGFASHLGLCLDTPTIGVAKTRLFGCYNEVGSRFGDQSKLLDEHASSNIIGAVICTRERSKPLFISAGHLIDLETAVAYVLACCRGHRLPEPTYWAHKLSRVILPSK